MDPIRDKILKRSKESNQDIIGKILSYAAIVLILAVVVSIFAFVFAKGIATFTENHASLKDFLTGTDWNPNSKGEDGKPLVGALPMIVGSFAVTLLAALFATPFAIGTALYMTELSSSKGRAFMQSVVELLVGIPSVFTGLSV